MIRRLAAHLLATVWLFTGCTAGLHPDFSVPYICRTGSPVVSALFLIGDAGAPQLPDAEQRARGEVLVDPVLSALADDVAERVAMLGAERTGVVFLGDNVYPSGLHPGGGDERERGERVLRAQILGAGAARAMFVLGNHDWDQTAADGYDRAIAQWRFLSEQGPNVRMLPEAGCPGPAAVDFGANLRLIFVDVWSALHYAEHPDDPLRECEPRPGGGRIVEAVRREFAENDGKRLVLAVHPPVVTGGPHGGYFSWKEHIFPLRTFDQRLWIPLPILGSLFPLARLAGVTDTDLTSTSYRIYVEQLRGLFQPGVPSLVASGHEHSLQIHVDGVGVFHAVSGAGSVNKVDYVHKLASDLMSLAAPGYMRLDEHADGTLVLEVTGLDDHHVPKRAYYTCMP